ncbi:MAG TPA: glycosyltransferase 87 family protein [Chloroflexota bacterium]|nr:glycosyltransferase 87 family protein [Chloroflexota bacterium]
MARTRRILALMGVGVVLAFYAELLAHAPATGQDFRNFYAAAAVLRHGGNPYDLHQLLRWEDRLYRPTTAAQRASLAGNPYVQGPPLAMALMPAVGLPQASVYRVYAALLAAAAVAALALLAHLQPVQHPWKRAFLLLISPVTFLGVLLGQPDAVLLLLLVLALWCLSRGRAAPAGFALALGLVKPQIMAGPIVLLAVLSWRRGQLGPYLAGLAAGVAAFAGSSLLVAGPAVVQGWAHELAGFGGTTVYTQVDISSLTTIYVGWAPHALGLALSVVTLIAWVGLCAMLWQDTPHPPTRSPSRGEGEHSSPRPRPGRGDGGEGPGERWWLALGLTCWLLATPYAHPHDDVLLVPVVWYLLDEGPYHGVARLVAVALFISWWLLPLASVLGLRPPVLRGLGIVPIALVATLLALQRPSVQRLQKSYATAHRLQPWDESNVRR